VESRDRLPRSFYARDTRRVARELLGKVLVHADEGVRRAVRIVETEAYHGPRDEASHARFGPTRDGFPSAVLVRAAEPLENVLHAARGPGNLCRALGIRRETHNGLDLTGETLFVENASTPRERIITSPRVGVQYAGVWAERPWRYSLERNPNVSRPLPAIR
jgi:DNA-3-methyladenine glycosylase